MGKIIFDKPEHNRKSQHQKVKGSNKQPPEKFTSTTKAFFSAYAYDIRDLLIMFSCGFILAAIVSAIYIIVYIK